MKTGVDRLFANGQRLCLFDCDGTLVDSQFGIITAMTQAFTREGLQPPTPLEVKRIVGLSLDAAVAALLPGHDAETYRRLAEGYATAVLALRAADPHLEPLFPGAREGIHHLHQEGWIIGMATGKSRRGALSTLERHGLSDLFATIQTPDRLPGKPHPAMVEEAMAETGVAAGNVVVVGDTTFDVQMARAAGVAAIGVAWGYHPVDELRAAGADVIIECFEELSSVLSRMAIGE